MTAGRASPIHNDAYLYHIALSVGVPPFWAEDCCQEMRIALWQDGLDPEASGGAFVAVPAKREAIDFRRRFYGRSGWKQEPVPFAAIGERDDDDSGLIEFAEPERDIDAVLDGETFLNRLRPRTREILLLYAYGLTWRAIGLRYHVSEGRACQIGRDGMKRLRRMAA